MKEIHCDSYRVAVAGCVSLVFLLTSACGDGGQPAITLGRIAFASDRDGNAEIYVMNADGSDQIRLTDDPAFDTFPAWSP